MILYQIYSNWHAERGGLHVIAVAYWAMTEHFQKGERVCLINRFFTKFNRLKQEGNWRMYANSRMKFCLGVFLNYISKQRESCDYQFCITWSQEGTSSPIEAMDFCQDASCRLYKVLALHAIYETKWSLKESREAKSKSDQCSLPNCLSWLNFFTYSMKSVLNE